jgi:hypothetical protein
MDDNCIMAVIDRTGELPDPPEPVVKRRQKQLVATKSVSEPSDHPPSLDKDMGDADAQTGLGDTPSGNLEGAEGGGEPGESSSYTDEGFAHLATVVSSFCIKMDKNYRGLRQEMSQLREEVLLSSPTPPRRVQVPEVSHVFGAAAEPQRSHHDPLVPRLTDLRQDSVLHRQASNIVDALDCSVTGNARYTKYGWVRCGGDMAPRVPTAWPHDHVIGQGKSSKLFYDDLNIFEFTQGILSIIECEQDVSRMRQMLAHYRAVFRDAQNHGFEAAKWANGYVLSLLEKGKVTWDNEFKMAEERRDALTARSTVLRDSAQLYRDPRPVRPSQADFPRNNSGKSNGNRQKVVKACAFFNSGTCPNSGNHETASTRWKHVCRECWEPGHTDRECNNK